MRITGVNVYQVDLPMNCNFNFGGAEVVKARDSTIVEVLTDSGLKGYGEVCPFSPSYLPGFGAGVRAGLQELVPHILGANPLELGKLNRIMDHRLKGHNYIKAGLDIACWDILGKHCNLPLYTILGGHYTQPMPIYKTIVQGSDEEAAADVDMFKEQGWSIIQLKVSSGDVDDDIDRIKMVREALPAKTKLFVDPNGGWLMHEALRVADAARDLKVYLEQPCRTYQECLTLRAHTNLPIMLDESVGDVQHLLQVIKDQSADVVKIKPSTYGGITKIKQARDLFVEHGIAVSIEETWGSGITDATIAHLAQSTPPRFLFSAVNFSSYVPVKVAADAPEVMKGRLMASDGPGLGITPIPEALGEPVLSMDISNKKRPSCVWINYELDTKLQARPNNLLV